MAIASYRVRRESWLRWRWEIERDGRPLASGHSLARRLARRAARARLAREAPPPARAEVRSAAHGEPT